LEIIKIRDRVQSGGNIILKIIEYGCSNINLIGSEVYKCILLWDFVNKTFIGSEVFTPLAVKNAVFWNLMTCDSCKNLLFLRSVLRLLVIANVVPSSPILVTLMVEAILSSETSVLTGATRRFFPGDGVLQGVYSPFSLKQRKVL
jgi:hypothetical protein